MKLHHNPLFRFFAIIILFVIYCSRLASQKKPEIKCDGYLIVGVGGLDGAYCAKNLIINTGTGSRGGE